MRVVALAVLLVSTGALAETVSNNPATGKPYEAGVSNPPATIAPSYIEYPSAYIEGTIAPNFIDYPSAAKGDRWPKGCVPIGKLMSTGEVIVPIDCEWPIQRDNSPTTKK